MRTAIFGCGWLGRSLAEKLSEKHTVFGAVRSDASMLKLHQHGINAFQEPDKDSVFWDVETLIISVPPRESYLEMLKKVVRNCGKSVKQIVLLSSISVYDDVEGPFDEQSTIRQEYIVAQGEALFKRLFSEGVIVRLGGLMGEDRIAGQWGSTQLQDAPVNYIHRVDAVGIIAEVIEQKIRNEVINAVAPQHPRRSELYKKNCAQFGFDLPKFSAGRDRIVVSEKSRELLGYRYVYEDPMHFWSDTPDRPRQGQQWSD